MQHEPTEHDVGFTHGVHQLGDGVQHKLLLQHALLQVLLQNWLQALQVAGILGSLGNTHYTLSLSGHTWKPGSPWYNRSSWLGVKHPGYLLGNLGNTDNTLSLYAYTWRPRQHTLYTVTVWAYLEAWAIQTIHCHCPGILGRLGNTLYTVIHCHCLGILGSLGNTRYIRCHCPGILGRLGNTHYIHCHCLGILKDWATHTTLWYCHGILGRLGNTHYTLTLSGHT